MNFGTVPYLLLFSDLQLPLLEREREGGFLLVSENGRMMILVMMVAQKGNSSPSGLQFAHNSRTRKPTPLLALSISFNEKRKRLALNRRRVECF